MDSANNNRLAFIDIARTYAVYLALLTHALHNFGIPRVGSFIYNYPYFTSMATPMFIFMFGVMMELAYVNKSNVFLNAGELDSRLIKRSFQCYLAYCFTALSAFIGGYLTTKDFFLALIFLSDSRYGNILFLYTITLLLMPFILRLRIKLGRASFFWMLTPLILIYFFNEFFESIAFGHFGYVINKLTGMGDASGGPSVLFGLLFVLTGMVAGSYSSRSSDSKAIYVLSLVICSIFITILFIRESAFTIDSIKTVMTDYAYGQYRSAQNLNYYFLGTTYALITFCSIKILVDKVGLFRYLGLRLSAVAISSLFAFSIGNIVLNLMSDVSNFISPIISLSIFFIAVTMMSIYKEKLPLYNILNKLFKLNFANRREKNNLSP